MSSVGFLKPLSAGLVERVNGVSGERAERVMDRMDTLYPSPFLTGGGYVPGILLFGFIMLLFAVVGGGEGFKTMANAGLNEQTSMGHSMMLSMVYLLIVSAFSLVMMILWKVGFDSIEGRMRDWFNSIKEQREEAPYNEKAQNLHFLRPVNYWYAALFGLGVVFLLAQAYLILPTFSSLMMGGMDDEVVRSLVGEADLIVYSIIGVTMFFILGQVLTLLSLNNYVRVSLICALSDEKAA